MVYLPHQKPLTYDSKINMGLTLMIISFSKRAYPNRIQLIGSDELLAIFKVLNSKMDSFLNLWISNFKVLNFNLQRCTIILKRVSNG